jgi:peptidoglycan/xylan/chitin deacetylase (PgdA/CDA1 family)
MLNFRRINLLTGAAILAMMALYFLRPFPLLYFLIPVLLWVAHVFYGCYYIDSGFFIRLICEGDPAEKRMALTFDDGPSADHTPAILELLKTEGVKATFFCIGKHIEGNENILKQTHEEGHTIGNHSYSHHFLFDLFSRRKMIADLKSCDQIVNAVIKVTPRMFRPPYGVTNPQVRDAIMEGNYFPVGWNIRSMDTVIQDPNRLKNRVISRFAPGAIILFHDSGKCTAAILRDIIAEAQHRGYTFVTVDQLLNLKPYA